MSEIAGMAMVEYVNQRDIWVTAAGPEDIASMSDGHRALAARWLSTHATAIISVIEGAYHESIIAEEGKYTIQDVLGLIAQNPRNWIANTPLYCALVRGLPEQP